MILPKARHGVLPNRKRKRAGLVQRLSPRASACGWLSRTFATGLMTHRVLDVCAIGFARLLYCALKYAKPFISLKRPSSRALFSAKRGVEGEISNRRIDTKDVAHFARFSKTRAHSASAHARHAHQSRARPARFRFPQKCLALLAASGSGFVARPRAVWRHRALPDR